MKGTAEWLGTQMDKRTTSPLDGSLVWVSAYSWRLLRCYISYSAAKAATPEITLRSKKPPRKRIRRQRTAKALRTRHLKKPSNPRPRQPLLQKSQPQKLQHRRLLPRLLTR